MRISAIVATLNDAERLPACLAALREADEIIVSDGGSSDDSLAIARHAGAEILCGPAGLGAQFARGAKAARHGGLLFVPASTVLDAPAVWRARKHLNRSLRPGCFWLCIDDDARQARWVERATDWRTRVLQLSSPSQCLAVRKDRYLEAGGYRPLPALEHEDLLHRLPPMIQLPDDAYVSGDAWRQEGWLRRSARSFVRLGLWHVGLSPKQIRSLIGTPAARNPLSTHRAQPAE
jgi:glycosyltransferase involved in cell wall biosynthesis